MIRGRPRIDGSAFSTSTLVQAYLDGIARLDKQVALHLASLDRSHCRALPDLAISTDLRFDLRNIATAIAEGEMKFLNPKGRANKAMQRHMLSTRL